LTYSGWFTHISYRSSAGQRKHAGQRPTFYRWTTPGPAGELSIPLTWIKRKGGERRDGNGMGSKGRKGERKGGKRREEEQEGRGKEDTVSASFQISWTCSWHFAYKNTNDDSETVCRWLLRSFSVN